MGKMLTTSLSQSEWLERGARAILSVSFGLTLLFAMGIHAAYAADDDEETFEEKILHGLIDPFMKSKPDIDYRERSPLVVPPTRDLPPPESSASVINNPAWPVDADIKRAKENARIRREARRRNPDDDARVLRPDQMVRGPVKPGAGNGPSAPQDVAGSDGRVMSPNELGYKGGLFSGLFSGGSTKQETAVFAGEPARGNLTDPPAGYRTPSPNQPYGLGTEKYQPKAYDFSDKPVGN
jgi:hypothetical protein